MSVQSYLTLGETLDYSLPGSSVHGILQARIPLTPGVSCRALLQGIFPTQGSNPSLLVSCIAGGLFTVKFHLVSPGWRPRWCEGYTRCLVVQNGDVIDLLPRALWHSFPGSCLSADRASQPRTTALTPLQASGPSHRHMLYLCVQASYSLMLLFWHQSRGQANVSYWKNNSKPTFYQ